MRPASCVGEFERARPRANFEIRGFQLQRHRRAGELLGFQARRDLLGQAPQDFFERTEIRQIALERGFRGHALGFAIGAHRAVVEAAGEPRQAAAFLAVAAEQLDLADPLQIGDAMKTVAGEPRHAGLADAVDEARRFWRQEGRGLAAAEHGKAARLVEIGGDLGEEFVAGEPDRHRDAQRLLDLGGKPRQRLGRPHAVQPFGAGEIEERFVDRQRLDQRRQRQHHRPHFAAGLGIFLHIGPHHFGMRTKPQRLVHRHRRPDAVGARDIAARGDDTAPAAADDHRLGGERGVVALFDGGVERVAIDVRDRQRRQFVMANEARRAAGRTARRLRRRIGKAVAAEAHSHRTSSRYVAFPIAAERIAGPRHSGRIDAGRIGEGQQETLVGEHMLQHAGEKVGLVRQLTKPIERQSGRTEQPVEPFRLFGDEGKGLNRQHFRGFPRGRGGPFHRVPFAFP